MSQEAPILGAAWELPWNFLNPSLLGASGLLREGLGPKSSSEQLLPGIWGTRGGPGSAVGASKMTPNLLWSHVPKIATTLWHHVSKIDRTMILKIIDGTS